MENSSFTRIIYMWFVIVTVDSYTREFNIKLYN